MREALPLPHPALPTSTWRERYGAELLQILDEDEERASIKPYVDLVHSGLAERAHQFERLVWSGVRFARGRAVALGAGLVVAAVAFSLLTASVERRDCEDQR